jgi:hypothetical protein
LKKKDKEEEDSSNRDRRSTVRSRKSEPEPKANEGFALAAMVKQLNCKRKARVLADFRLLGLKQSTIKSDVSKAVKIYHFSKGALTLRETYLGCLSSSFSALKGNAAASKQASARYKVFANTLNSLTAHKRTLYSCLLWSQLVLAKVVAAKEIVEALP